MNFFKKFKSNVGFSSSKTPLLDEVDKPSDDIEYFEKTVNEAIAKYETQYLLRSYAELNPWWEYLRSDPSIRLKCKNSTNEYVLRTYCSLLRSERVVFIPSRDIDVIIAIRIPYLDRRVYCKFEIYDADHRRIHKGPTITLIPEENMQYINNGKPIFQSLIQRQNYIVSIRFLDEEPPPIPHSFEIFGLSMIESDRNILFKNSQKFSPELIDKNWEERNKLSKNSRKKPDDLGLDFLTKV